MDMCPEITLRRAVICLSSKSVHKISTGLEAGLG